MVQFTAAHLVPLLDVQPTAFTHVLVIVDVPALKVDIDAE